MSNYPVRRTREDAFNYAPRGDETVVNHASVYQQHVPQPSRGYQNPRSNFGSSDRPEINSDTNDWQPQNQGEHLSHYQSQQQRPYHQEHQNQYRNFQSSTPPHVSHQNDRNSHHMQQPPSHGTQHDPYQPFHTNSPHQYPQEQHSYQYQPPPESFQGGGAGQIPPVPHRSSTNDLEPQYQSTPEPDSDAHDRVEHSPRSGQVAGGYSRTGAGPGAGSHVNQVSTVTGTGSPKYGNISHEQDNPIDYANVKSTLTSSKSKASKYGMKSSAAAMNQYSHRAPQEKSLHNLQNMTYHNMPRRVEGQYTDPHMYPQQQYQQQRQPDTPQQPLNSPPQPIYPTSASSWQSTREQRRQQGHSSVSAYRSLPDQTSNLYIQQPGSNTSHNTNAQPQADDSDTDAANQDLSDHDFVTWARLQDPYDMTEAMERDPTLMTKTDANSNSLLHGGAEVGNISLVEFMLKNLSAKDSKKLLHSFDKDGLNPLHIAVSKGMLHIIKKLIKFDRLLVERKTKDGSTVLHLAVSSRVPMQIINLLIEILDEDIIWATDATGSTALHLACMEGSVPIMKALLKVEGADVNKADGQGQSCLHISIILGHYLMTKALLALDHPFKPAIEQTGNQNNTSLHYACSNHQYNLVKLLLEHGANVNAKNKMKLTPNELANDEIIDLLFANKEKFLPKKILKPVSSGKKSKPTKGSKKVDDSDDSEEESEEEEFEEDEESEEEEDDDEDDEEDEEENSDESLFESVKVGCVADLESVIGSDPSLKRNVNKIRDSESKATLLHVAAKHGHLDVAQYLVEGAGASVDLKDEYGMTPLHYAVEAQQLLVVRYLVKYCGAKLDVKDNAGNLAIDLADEDEADDEDNFEELCRIIQKSVNKPPAKRKLVKSPVIPKGLV